MIEANVEALRDQLSAIEIESRRIRKLLDRFDTVDGAVELTDEQKADLLAPTGLGQLTAKHTDAVTIFAADKAVVSPELGE